MKQIKVLVVDDSAFMRKMISDILNSEEDIEVIATARDGIDAIEKVIKLSPDVITMDIEMPQMNGLDTLKYIVKHNPTPVIMLSTLTQEGTDATLKALEYGAFDFIAKPSGNISLDINKIAGKIIERVRVAVSSKVSQWKETNKSNEPKKMVEIQVPTKKETPLLPKEHAIKSNNTNISNLFAIGTSTGGPKALQVLLADIPKNFNGAMLIVQHMPPGFTKPFAERLNSICPIRVLEAQDGDLVENHTAYIAPGDYHMEVKQKSSGELYLSVHQNVPKRDGHRPSVDVLFESVSRIQHPRKFAVIMTGMGSDGTKGVELLKKTGLVESIAEDESTCVVFGMPRAAINSGNIDTILPLNRIAQHLLSLT